MTQHHHTIRAARFARIFMPFVLIAAASVLALTFSSLVPAASLGPCGGDVHVPNQVSLCGTASGKATQIAVLHVHRDIFRNGGWGFRWKLPDPYGTADARVSFAPAAIPAGSTITSAVLTWSSNLSTKDAGASYGVNLPGPDINHIGARYPYCDWYGGSLASVKNFVSDSFLANHIEVVGRSPTAIPGTTTALSASPITTTGSLNLLSVYPASALASTITLVATVSYETGNPRFETEGQGCTTEFDVGGGYGQVNVSAMLRVTYTPPATPAFQVRDLVGAGVPAANLRGAGGLVIDSNGIAWVAAKGTGVTLYDAQGNAQPLAVSVPSPDGKWAGKATGIALNPGDFVIANGRLSAPADVIIATEDGAISGYSFNVDATHAVPAVWMSGAVYKGIAISTYGAPSRLYAADFHANKIDVFAAPHFSPIKMIGAFADPNLPPGYSPHNIVAIGDRLLIAYAPKDKNGEVVAASGGGIINAYDLNGRLLQRVATGGTLNAPWGMAIAPASFGDLSGSLLVGNYGDGTINAFNLATGAFVGQLRTPAGAPLSIPGLFGLAFGQNSNNQQTLFFAAGDQASGVFGRIDVVPPAR